MLNALDGRPLPIYGDGGNVRDWLHVEDHCAGHAAGAREGAAGREVQHRRRQRADQPRDRRSHLRRARSAACRRRPIRRCSAASSYRDLKTFVPIGPGHDRRYAIDATKIRRELGWAPRHDVRGRACAPPCAGISSTATGASRSRPGGTTGERLGLGVTDRRDVALDRCPDRQCSRC